MAQTRTYGLRNLANHAFGENDHSRADEIVRISFWGRLSKVLIKVNYLKSNEYKT